MNRAVPWSIKGVDFDAREAAKEAARRDGVSLGEWMNRAISERAAEIGVSEQEFDADERLEAVAAQLARLSREADGRPTPQRRRGEAGRRPEPRAERDTPASAGRRDAADWDEDFNEEADDAAENRPRRRAPVAPPERVRAKGAPRDAYAKEPRDAYPKEPRDSYAKEPRDDYPSRYAAESRRVRPVRDGSDAEALLEQAVAAFQDQAGRSEARTARAIANVATLIETAESDRSDALAQVDARLADLEQKLHRGATDSVKPLRGMISSVHDRLVDIEGQLQKKERSSDYKPLRHALDRLEARIESMSNQSAEPVDETLYRQIDSRLADIAAKIEKAETTPPGAARDDHFQRLERRFEALMERLERQNARPAASAAAPAPVAASASPARRGLEGAISAIAARQQELDSGLKTARAPNPPLAAMIEERFEALSRKLDGAAAKSVAPREDERIDRLQHGIEALSGHLENMRREFAAANGFARATGGPGAGVEKSLRDLSARVEAALSAPSVAGPGDLLRLHEELATIGRALTDVAPRGAVAGIESAMRDLGNRVETARDAMLRAAEVATRAEASLAASATRPNEIETLRGDIAAMGRMFGDVAPRAAVVGLESAIGKLGDRVEVSLSASALRPDDVKDLRGEIAAMGRALGDVAPRASVAGLESAMGKLGDRVEASLAASALRPDDVKDLRGEIVAMGRALGDVAPRASVAGLESAIGKLGDRVEASLAASALRPDDVKNLRGEIAAMGRALGDVAPRASVAGLESAMGKLGDRVETTREAALRGADLAARAEASLAASALRSEDVKNLRGEIAAMGRMFGDVAPRAAVVGLESAVRDLGQRVDKSRDALLSASGARGAYATSGEIEALSRQVVAMSHALADVAPRSQLASLANAVHGLGERIERSRTDGLREAVLTPIETLAGELRSAMAEAGATANYDGVAVQLRDVEKKLEELRRSGGADRDDFLAICDRTDDLRAMVAEVAEKMAPMERVERQVAALSDRLEEVARQAVEGGLAQGAADWRGVETRLDDLASRIERVATERGEPQYVDDTRFDDLSRRLDFVHQALAARIATAQGELQGQTSSLSLERLLRSLSEKLDAAAAPQADSRTLAALERQMAQVSERLEIGDPQWGAKLERAIEALAQRIETSRESEHEAARQALREAMAGLPQPGRDEEAARAIADLREKHEMSDLRAQQTLSAVHETLEKVVDRLAMIEDDVLEARAAQDERLSAPPAPVVARMTAGKSASSLAAAPSLAAALRDSPAASHFDDEMLMEPGAGRPGERQSHRDQTANERPDVADFDAEHDDAASAASRHDEIPPGEKPIQANYIDVARRAIAARAAAEAAAKVEADQRKRAKMAAAERATNDRVATNDGVAAFVRPLKVGEKANGRRLPTLLAMAGAVLVLGAYQAYRVFDVAPPLQSVVEPRHPAAAPADDKAAAPAAPAAAAPAAAPAPASGAAAPSAVAPSAAAPADAAPMAAGQNSAPILPSMMTAPKPAQGALMVDPLAVGAIGPRTNTLSAVAASAQIAALKELAGKGDAAAQYDMGSRVYEGRGVSRDPAAAAVWFEKAAAQNLAQAQFRLGGIYEKGVGVPRDPDKARDYYQKAATQGHVRAMHNLAVMQAEGVEGKPDYASAAQWFRRAADYGVRDSQFNLAILYARGMGVTQNLGQSYVWFDIAARQGDEDAAKKRDEIAARLDAATLDAARKQASDFRARTPAAAINDPPAVPAGPAAAFISAPVIKAALSKF